MLWSGLSSGGGSQAEVEARDREAAKLHAQLDRVLQDTAEKDADLATSHSSLGSMRQAVEALQGDLAARGDVVQAASGELDEARHVLAATQAELEGLRAAMLAAQARHMEQLAR
jgi:chromosome segregation ATPase